MKRKDGVEKKVREIRRKTRKRYSAEEKIRIVLEGLRGEESIAAKHIVVDWAGVMTQTSSSCDLAQNLGSWI